MSERNEKDTRITLRDLFFYILRRWRSIVIVGFGCAFLFGAYRGVKLLMMVQSDEYQEKVKTNYEDKMKNQESEIKRIDREMTRLETSLNERKEYEEQSLLMKMDPQDSWIASADVYISDISGTSASALSGIFQSALNNGSISQRLADKLHVEEKYIRELMRTYYYEYTTEYPEIEQPYMLTDQILLHVGLIAVDREMASELMDEIERAFKELREEIAGDVVSYDLKILNRTYLNCIVQELEDYQDSIHDTVENIPKEMKSRQKERDKLLKQVYKAPWSVTEIVLSVFKFFLLGGFIGGCLSLVFLLVACLYTDKILSPDELRKRTGLNVIMVSEPKKKHWGAAADKLIRDHELSGELFLLKSMQKLMVLDHDPERYITWGDQSKEVLGMLFPDSRQKTVLNMEEMDSWQSLLPEKEQGEDGHAKYVLVAERGKTTYREIDSKLEVIRRFNGQDIMIVIRV